VEHNNNAVIPESFGTQVIDETDPQQLAEATMHVPASFIVATSVATRDFYPVHHDPEFARAGGLETIILNVHTAVALVSGYALRSVGEELTNTSTNLRLIQPVYADDELTFRGHSSKRPDESFVVHVEAVTRRGTSMIADVELSPHGLPEPADPNSTIPAPWNEPGHRDQSLEALADMVGKPFGPLQPSLEPVADATLIRLWHETIECGCAVDVLPRQGFAGVPAPMLQVWDMPGTRMAFGPIWSDGRADANAVLASLGFTKSVTVAALHSYHRQVEVGDQLTAQTVFESMGPLRHTAVGEGYFLVWRTDLWKASGESIGSVALTLLKYRPGPLST
jgi:acyl dehydratase